MRDSWRGRSPSQLSRDRNLQLIIENHCRVSAIQAINQSVVLADCAIRANCDYPPLKAFSNYYFSPLFGISGQFPLWDEPIANRGGCIHQNKYPVQDDEHNYHDFMKAAHLIEELNIYFS